MDEQKLPRWARLFALIWGLGGLGLLLLGAIWRLSIRVLEEVNSDLTVVQMASFVLVVAFMAYSEGYRGFQKSFSPRAAARALHLRDDAQLKEALLAPFFLLGFLKAPRRLKIASYALTALIVACITVFSYFPAPWRGILDAGVVVGLGWGTISLTLSTATALSSDDYPVSPELG